MSAQLAQALKAIVDFWDECVPDDCVNDMHANARKALAAFEAAPQQAQAPSPGVCDLVQVEGFGKHSRSQHDADSAELRSLCAERDELRRWKSTYAPRLAALEGSLQHAQREAAQGMEARSALASEREANAILTDELEAQQAQAPGWQLVPEKITEEQHVAACKVLLRADGMDGLPQRMLDAIRAAAPQQGSNT